MAKLYSKKRSQAYRAHDETLGSNPAYTKYGENLRSICKSFPNPINILDIGIGTGRYLSTLRNVNYLIGIDPNIHMLNLAKHPYRENLVRKHVPRIQLICGDIHTIEFTSNHIDFAFSIGVLAEHTGFTVEVLNKIYTALKINGKIFITLHNLKEQEVADILNQSMFNSATCNLLKIQDRKSLKIVIVGRKL